MAPDPAAVPEVMERESTELAPRYRVLVHNDSVTTFHFVIDTLRTVFSLDAVASVAVTLEAHEKGVALVATLPLEQAEFKIDRAHSIARAAKFPLTFTCERE
jgi:ATP-dependent Clp protease adaptor protein ClpS